MKTPRDILFARHQAAAPKLDAIRREVLQVELWEGRRVAVPKFGVTDTATLPETSAKQRAADILSAETAANIGFFSADYKSAALLQRSLPISIWRELIFPCRRIWTGLAAVWVLIFIVNISQRDGSQTVIAKSSPPPEMMMTFRDQQKLLNELFADRSLPVEAEPPRIYLPKPRTETMKFLTA